MVDVICGSGDGNVMIRGDYDENDNNWRVVTCRMCVYLVCLNVLDAYGRAHMCVCLCACLHAGV